MPISLVLVKLQQKPQVQAQLIKFQTNQSCIERPCLKKIIYFYAINHLINNPSSIKIPDTCVWESVKFSITEPHAHFLDYSQKNHVALYIFQSVVMNVHSTR